VQGRIFHSPYAAFIGSSPPQDYDNASAVLSKAAKLMADTDGRAACDLFIAAMDIMKVFALAECFI
jgi:hypothetical protein